MSWSQLNAGATIPQEHATGCNSMQNRPASKTPAGLHLAAQVRHVHSVKKQSPAQQQHLVPPATRHARPAKPATLSPVCKQWGCPAVVRCVCVNWPRGSNIRYVSTAVSEFVEASSSNYIDTIQK